MTTSGSEFLDALLTDAVNLQEMTYNNYCAIRAYPDSTLNEVNVAKLMMEDAANLANKLREKCGELAQVNAQYEKCDVCHVSHEVNRGAM